MRLFVFDSILMMKTFSCTSFAFDTHAHSYHQCICVESRRGSRRAFSALRGSAPRGLLGPHPRWVAAAGAADGHAVAHGDVRQVVGHGVALAVVAVLAAVVLPAGRDAAVSSRPRARENGSREGEKSSFGGSTHQCVSVISSSAAASKMVGPASSSSSAMSARVFEGRAL